MKKLNSNSIIGIIILIIFYTAITIMSITAIPYAIIRGVCNLDYYDEWASFLFKHIPFSKSR